MAKKPRIADPDAIRAARNAISEIREARNRAKSDLCTTIVTGVPRRGRDGNFPDDYGWKPKPPASKETASAPPPKAKIQAVPPKEWHYVWIQTRAPRSDNDCGEIIEGQYATTGTAFSFSMTRAVIQSLLRNCEATIIHC